MGRNLDSKCSQCRRAGEKLFLKGARCFSPKCAVTRRNYAPGIHGAKRKSAPTEYGQQLREKQNLKKMYRLLERQFANYFDLADRQEGVTADNLIRLLESRLDNTVYRMGFALSRDEARQLVNHGHFKVNGKKVDVPSMQVKKGDVIEVRPESKAKRAFENLEKRIDVKAIPSWLEVNIPNMKAQVMQLPDAQLANVQVNMRLIVEFYSK